MVEIKCTSPLKKLKRFTQSQGGKDCPMCDTKKENSLVLLHLVWNCHLKHVIEGKIERRGRPGRRRKQILDDLEERRGYWKLKERALASNH
jgi:hypothetical protein